MRIELVTGNDLPSWLQLVDALEIGARPEVALAHLADTWHAELESRREALLALVTDGGEGLVRALLIEAAVAHFDREVEHWRAAQNWSRNRITWLATLHVGAITKEESHVEYQV